MNLYFDTLIFRHVVKTDVYDSKKYNHWSRFWEYPLVNKFLNENIPHGSKIHNTCWGFEPPNHTDFKTDLESFYGVENVVNSDIRPSNLENTTIYDITTYPKDEWINYFDAVINVSTLEEVNYDHIKCFEHLLLQVKKNGYLILTFDIPGLNIQEFENYLGFEFNKSDDAISGMGLNVGFLVCKKH